MLNMMNKQNWITFEAFRNCAFGIWCVTMPNPLTEFNWKKGSCTCPTYYKKYICKHLIGIAIRLSADTKVKVSIQAKNIKIGSKRRVGRPALAKPALVRQPFRSLIDADDADLDENDEVDDDIPFDEDLNLELNQLTHSQRENIDRDYYDRLYCNELDVSLMNNNGNMFGLQDIQPTTSSILSSDNSTLPYNMDHISNICDDYVLTDLNILTTSIAMTDDTRPLQSIATTSSSILPTIQSPKSILKVAGKQADTLKKQRGRPKMTDEEKAESAKQREIKRQKR